MRGYILVSLLVVSISFAQENVPPPSVFRSGSAVVLVPALVKNHSGELVYGLQADDFIIEDDGVVQSAQLDEMPESQPVSLVIAIETGRRAAREFGRMRGLPALLGPILNNANIETAVLFFDSKPEVTLDFTNDPDEVTQHLKDLRAGDNGAAILDAVDLSVKLLSKRSERRRRVLLLISETRDHASSSANRIEHVIAQVGEGNVVVYALAFSASRSQVLDTMRGNNRDEGGSTADILAALIMARNAMKKNIPLTVATMTGGEYGLFETLKGFESGITLFNNHLYNRYLLSFQPKNPRSGLHQIRVRLKSPEKRTVTARTNYWAAGGSQERIEK
jgi:VWFA-related protein